MENRRSCCTKCACPFAYSEKSEQVQNYGCLPTSFDIVVMKVKYNKTWACHSNPDKPCLGSLLFLKDHGFKYKPESELITEDSDWYKYTEANEDEVKEIRTQIQEIKFNKLKDRYEL